MSGEWPAGDDELDEFLEGWDAVDQDAAAVLRGALDDLRGQCPPDLAPAAGRVRDGLRGDGDPFAWIYRAAGFEHEPLPDTDVELLLRCASATISPREETGLDADEESVLLSLQHADWLGAIVSAVRGGTGADASPSALVAGIDTCPEVELEADGDPDDEAHLRAAFWILALPWHLLGLTDREHRLTAVGHWILPRALARAWNADFDAPDD